jgi:acetyl esterase/lipase
MTSARDVQVEDISYRETAGGPLLARLYRPSGKGPFPAVVSVHGGRWVSADRLTNAVIDQALAQAGIVVMALDFRMPPVARYPEPVADINFAIRWLKGAASRLGSSPALVGGIGTSSGGHQLMLNVLRPNDPRYAALPLPGSDADASLPYVVACWPVLDPLRRYQMAKQKNMELHVKSHEAYWPDEAAMAEGNPQTIVERGETRRLPPVLLIQGTGDTTVPPEMTQRFADAYRAKGGTAILETYEGKAHTFITQEPDSEPSRAAIARIIKFVLDQTKQGLGTAAA